MSYRLSAKDPDSVEPFEWDFTGKIGDTTDTILTTTATALTGGCVVGVTGFTGQVMQAWLSGGTAGEVATVRARITTTAGRTLDMTAEFDISDM